ncbi:MAG TPA: Crp/Fnr family transcriptional regulator [Xanthobacteraceae bacterium]|jgi:CRP/FNR family cyclic AMP-dependent transcriptional regulator
MATMGAPTFDPIALIKKYGGAVGSIIGKNQVIYAQGDVADHIFYIQKGQIQLTVLSAEGKEAIIAVLEAGDFSGEGCLVGEPLRMFSATSLTECIVARLEKAAALRAIHEDPGFSESLVSYVLKHTSRLTDNLVDQLFNSSEKRLARVLLLLANYGKEGRTETVLGKIDQEALGQMIGATRSRVNFFMNKFRKLGLIKYNGLIHVHSSLLRVVLHDQPLGEHGEGEFGATDGD